MGSRWSIMSWLILSLLASSVDAVRIVRPDLRDFAATPANSVPITRSTTEHRRLAQSVSVEVPGSPDAHLVTDLPLLSPEEFPTKHWAGHLPASPNNDKYFFYWLFEPEGNYDKDTVPLIIWLNGGPGCSSMDGLFLENGPFRLEMDEDENYQIKAAEHSWHKSPAYTLYIDQPVGTGLSFTTSGHYPSNDELVNVDFYHFIQSFFQLHSDKFVDHRVRNPLWFSGESHAGHYIPSMMNYILKQNDDLKDGDIEIPLAGAAIGNGWTDPVHQYAAAEAAYGHGIIDRAQLTAMSAQERVCQQKLEKGQMIVSECFRLLDDVVRQSQGIKSEYKISQYDVRKTESTQHSDRDFPPGHKVVETFLGGWPMKDDPGKLSTDISVEVLKAIHATSATAAGQRFQECTDPPYNALAHQDGKGVVEDVIAVLEHAANVKLLFFNGVQDLICNHVGNEVMLEKLPWKHQDDWIKAERFAWRAESEQVSRISGYVKEFENLSFLKVLSAGHMVPMDVPEVSLDMMRVLVGATSFQYSMQKLDRAKATDGTCPECPTCPSQESSADFPSANGENHSGAFVFSYAWVVTAMALVTFVALLAVFRRSGLQHPTRTLVPQHDLEMREAKYHDEPMLDVDSAEYGETSAVI